MKSPVEMIRADQALPGRSTPVELASPHLVYERPLDEAVSSEHEEAFFALGCFWGAEKLFFTTPGVVMSAVGYQGGFTPHPTYAEVCSGQTGHAEVVRVVFDPHKISYRELVAKFFEGHDPTQGFRQGADIGTQYRSAIYTVDQAQDRVARDVAADYGERLRAAGYGPLTTDIEPAGPFYFAEDYHQQYLIANPNGYCGLGGTGVSCPVGLGLDASGSVN